MIRKKKQKSVIAVTERSKWKRYLPVTPAILTQRKEGGSPKIMIQKNPAIYILASRWNGTLYIGVTSNLTQRIWEHKQGSKDGFTLKYGVVQLVYYEFFDSMLDAIAREKQLKGWNREWKIRLIRKQNPDWNDLWDGILPNSSS